MGKESEAFFFNITYYAMNEWIPVVLLAIIFTKKVKVFFGYKLEKIIQVILKFRKITSHAKINQPIVKMSYNSLPFWSIFFLCMFQYRRMMCQDKGAKHWKDNSGNLGHIPSEFGKKLLVRPKVMTYQPKHERRRNTLEYRYTGMIRKALEGGVINKKKNRKT